MTAESAEPSREELQAAFNEPDETAPAAASNAIPPKPAAENPTDVVEVEAAEGKDAPPEPESTPAGAMAEAERVHAAKEQARRDKLLAEESERIERERAAREKAAAPASPTDVLKHYIEADDFRELSFTDPEAADGKRMTFADMATQYPMIAEAIVGVAERIAQRVVAPIAQAYQGDKLQALRENNLASLADQFGHNDARTLFDDPKVWEWADQQSGAVKALFNSADPKDLDLALRVYKEAHGIAHATAERAAAAKAKAVTAHRREVALHSDTTRSRRDVRTGVMTPEEERRAAWENDEDDIQD